MSVRNIKEFLPERTALVHYSLPLLCSVGDGNYRNTCAFEVLEGLNCVINRHLRKCARTGSEIMNLLHFSIIVMCFLY